MCMALYVATDRIIPTTDRSSGSLLSVQGIAASEERVREQFSKPHVRYVGAHGGCSCGFAYDPADPSGDVVLRSLAELRTLLERHLADADDAELLYLWEGDEGREPDRRVEVALEDLGTDACPLKTAGFYRVRRRRPTRS